MDERILRIRALNDFVRRYWVTGCYFLSAGINALSLEEQTEIIRAVRTFNVFTPSNDPHGEHDCAIVTVDGRRILWKIDYYDLELQGHSPDPTNTRVTKRVLTVMLAEEY